MSKEVTFPPIFKSSEDITVLDSGNKQQLRSYFEYELDVSKVNKMEKHLWFAGQRGCCRPLHLQKALRREIVVVESCHLHLTWRGAMIFIKPCPEFLLGHTWDTYLEADAQLRRNALGFLRTYVSLVRRNSDLKIAHELGLVSTNLNWERWSQISRTIAREPFQTCFEIGKPGKTKKIYDRWCYGELRLERLNWIFRLCFCSKREDGQLQRGFFNRYQDYRSFLERNIAGLTISTVYMALALTAMQVGLGTDRLKDSGEFTRAAVGFTIFSIVAPLTVLTLTAAIMLYKLVDNALYTLRRNRNAESRSSTNKGV
ncbi:hypothetical protein BKA58DRAFT_455467 [Alternaria rosae]|uniref:uncharacterized protein n=1 Tax=Alternaria rosae TaxID=1187941 RepID=UPI001E8E2ECC|nr:uncharacterized protein BKA58DRAFT_455467 [Alternaria rosae]KAH6876299.1 hypothetical protein BKA58DRAFT_455467 [Alternaria rosae]